MTVALNYLKDRKPRYENILSLGKNILTEDQKKWMREYLEFMGEEIDNINKEIHNRIFSKSGIAEIEKMEKDRCNKTSECRTGEIHSI